jgi:hypothetical protein
MNGAWKNSLRRKELLAAASKPLSVQQRKAKYDISLWTHVQNGLIFESTTAKNQMACYSKKFFILSLILNPSSSTPLLRQVCHP